MRTVISDFLHWKHALGAMAGLLLIPLAMGVFSIGPWSPLQLDRAHAEAGSGDIEAALVRYETHAMWTLFDHDRADALYIGGTLAAVEGEHQRAVRMLRAATRDYPQDERAPNALARLGEVLARDAHAPDRAAHAYLRAAEADPERAAEWSLRAAELQAEAGHPRLAFKSYERIAKEFPGESHRAWLAMGHLRLESGDAAGAARMYERVLQTGAVGEDLALAQLGATVSHEQLGRFEEVLAELDQTTMSDEAASRRRERVEARSPR
ncbi:MAG TPA: tetratricopeptide repeat protein [Myxococcota bacterium]|nr:tetratricopeptide repeat protein [Myxococcota bacterium]